MQRALRSFRDAKSSFLWKDASDPRFDSERNGPGVPFTSLVGSQLSFLVGTSHGRNVLPVPVQWIVGSVCGHARGQRAKRNSDQMVCTVKKSIKGVEVNEWVKNRNLVPYFLLLSRRI